jgi:hypothetical protein
MSYGNIERIMGYDGGISRKKALILKGQPPLFPDTLFDSPRETQATANQGDFLDEKT